MDNANPDTTIVEKAATPDLLPCPFCGGSAKLIAGWPGCTFAECENCNASTDDTEEGRAIAAWNRRALPAARAEVSVAEASDDSDQVLAVCWEWTAPQKFAGSRFWGCHSLTSDGRLRDWPKQGMRPIGAAKVTVIIGQGLELIPPAAADNALVAALSGHSALTGDQA